MPKIIIIGLCLAGLASVTLRLNALSDSSRTKSPSLRFGSPLFKQHHWFLAASVSFSEKEDSCPPCPNSECFPELVSAVDNCELLQSRCCVLGSSIHC